MEASHLIVQFYRVVYALLPSLPCLRLGTADLTSETTPVGYTLLQHQREQAAILALPPYKPTLILHLLTGILAHLLLPILALRSLHASYPLAPCPLQEVTQSLEAIARVVGGGCGRTMIPACDNRIGFSTAPVALGSWLLPAVDGDLLGLLGRLRLRSFELQFAVPSFNDGVSRTMALEMLTDQHPVASAVSADDPR